MTIYISIYLLILFFALNKKLKNTKVLFNLLLVVLGIFLCMGYMTGSDWRQYELEYNSLNSNDIIKYVKGYEYLYPALQMVFKSIGFTFWQFFITLKIILFFITIKTFEKYSQYNYAWGLLVFYGVFGLDAYIDNPMRNLIASVIFLSSIKYIISNKLLKYIIMIILASSFHMSALLLLPIYFIRNTNINKKIILISLVGLVIFAVIGQWAFRKLLVEFIWTRSNIIAERFNVVYLDKSFYENRNHIITVGFLVHVVMYILIFLKKEEIEKQKYGRLIFNLTYVYMIVYIVSFAIWIFFRMRLYLFVPFCISIAYLPYLYTKLYARLLSISIILIMSFFTMLSTITGSYKYIPYTNHIFYLFKNKPNFYERSDYNFRNSPYKD